MSSNTGYYEFVHEDDFQEDSDQSDQSDGLEWDEGAVMETEPESEDENWRFLYEWYGRTLESGGGSRGAAHHAARHGHVGVLRLLSRTSSNLEASDAFGYTPLHYAAEGGHEAATRLLLDTGSDPDRRTSAPGRRTALHLAAADGHARIVRLLRSAGAAPESRDDDERTPLFAAVERGHEEAAFALIDEGSNVNAEDVRGDTPLCAAIGRRSQALASGLLAAGARIPPDRRLLHRAVSENRADTVRLLIAHGSGVDLRDEHGDTPLLVAVRAGNALMVETLLDHGATVDLPNALTGATALHEAVGRAAEPSRFEEILVSLLDRGADPDAPCPSSGRSPLFRAIHSGRREEARLLIAHGADARAPDCLETAVAYGARSVARLLELAGAPTVGPRPLKHVARLAIRSAVSRPPLRAGVERLPLPGSLKEFLMFGDG